MQPSSHHINITTTAPSPASSVEPRPHQDLHPRLLFSTSEEFGGTRKGYSGEINDFSRLAGSGSQAFGSFLPALQSSNSVATASPRASSPAVGTIGGHRSPALGHSADASGSKDGSNTLSRPLSLYELGSKRDETLFAGFAGGMSSHKTSSAYSPFALGLDRPASALESAFNGKSEWPPSVTTQVNRAATISPPPSNLRNQTSTSSSPARAVDRPTSRLDFGILQQRSNAVAAAAAAAAASSSASTSAYTVSSQPSAPELVRPRPEVAPIQRSLSGESGQTNWAGVSPDRLSPSFTTQPFSHVTHIGYQSSSSSPNDQSAAKYPIVSPTHQQHHIPQQMAFTGQMQTSRTVIDRLNNRSRASQRSPAPLRIASPLDPNRHRFSSPVPFSFAESSFVGPSVQPRPAHVEINGTDSPRRQQTDPSSSLNNDHNQRLNTLEATITQLTRCLTGLARDVAWLMEREKMRNTEGPREVASERQTSQEDGIQDIRAQLVSLTGNVKQLVISQQQQQRVVSGGSSLNGLGLVGDRAGVAPTSPHCTTAILTGAPSTPSDGQQNPGRTVLAFPTYSGPQRGVSPRPVGVGGRTYTPQQQSTPHFTPSPNLNLRALSHSGSQRWNQPSMSNAAGNALSSSTPTATVGTIGHLDGSTLPTSVDISTSPLIVSKWEHLPLQPDLLRSVLKYGLGPPNKVQQRSLPFLLRGSDVIAQAPPTQERIASYVIPAIHVVLTTKRCPPPVGSSSSSNSSGPFVLIVTTTVDQATQAQRMVIGLGGALGVGVHLASGTGTPIESEIESIVQARPNIVIGTPTKMVEIITRLLQMKSDDDGGYDGPPNLGEVRMIVLDEVDQMIARNLSHHVGAMLSKLPSPSWRDGSPGGSSSPLISPSLALAGRNPFDSHPSKSGPTMLGQTFSKSERQTAIFSNTVPQDVLVFAQGVQLRESVRVLVRREGTSVTQHVPTTTSSNFTSTGSVSGPATTALHVPHVGTVTRSVSPAYRTGNAVEAEGATPILRSH